MDKLIVFVKAPRPGTVKTRLAVAIGPEEALAAYHQMVECVLASVSALPGVELRFTPDEARNEIAAWLHPGWTAAPQGEGDLGDRLQRAFASAFATGAGRVVGIGSDCPEVTAADIHAAWDALSENHVVLGPARDGGYWLIGLSQPCPALFSGIHWSTDSVMKETLDRARQAGLCVHQLHELADVDTVAEWREFQSRDMT
jgi:rSAM/selenodomain-associated transferase 1